jgi:hypothetical protein
MVQKPPRMGQRKDGEQLEAAQWRPRGQRLEQRQVKQRQEQTWRSKYFWDLDGVVTAL